jgi:hypothetical protein
MPIARRDGGIAPDGGAHPVHVDVTTSSPASFCHRYRLSNNDEFSAVWPSLSLNRATFQAGSPAAAQH